MRDGLTVGLGLPPRPPRAILDQATETALAVGADAMWTIDHSSSFIPQSIWDEGFSPAAAGAASPDQMYEYQSVLGYAAAKAPAVRPAVGVTEAIRRHPAILAQAALTLSHLSDRRPILGLGAGERENLDPFGWPFDRVSKWYPTADEPLHALDQISLEMDSGEFVAILGPSGCGKSTLILMIAGLVSYSHGDIWVDDTRISKPYTNLGVVFQQPVLLDWLNVGDNVLLQAKMRNLPKREYRQRAAELLELVGLEDFHKKRPGELDVSKVITDLLYLFERPVKRSFLG